MKRKVWSHHSNFGRTTRVTRLGELLWQLFLITEEAQIISYVWSMVKVM
jgi:hypothetical protein